MCCVFRTVFNLTSQEEKQSNLLWSITISTKKTTNKKQSVTKYAADGKRGEKRAKVTIAPDQIAYPKNKSKKITLTNQNERQQSMSQSEISKKFCSRGEAREIKRVRKSSLHLFGLNVTRTKAK